LVDDGGELEKVERFPALHVAPQQAELETKKCRSVVAMSMSSKRSCYVGGFIMALSISDSTWSSLKRCISFAASAVVLKS